MNNRIRYTLDEVQRNTFYQLPKFLFSDEFKGLSNDARVLYSLLRDRHDLSIKNHWVNNNNEVYLICSREAMQKMLGLTDKPVTRAMNDLKKHRLVDEERRGQGKPNFIYLLMLKNSLNTENRRTSDSRTGDSPILEPENLYPNNTDFNNTDFIETSYPIPSVLEAEENKKTSKEKTDEIGSDEISQTANEDGQKIKESLSNALADQSVRQTDKPSPVNYNYNHVEEIVKSQIDYDYLIETRKTQKDLIDEILFVMTSMICSEFVDGYITMGGERVLAESVKSVFFKLDYTHIEYFLDSFNKQTDTITRLTPYILKSLYKNYGTISHHFTNRVHVDMPYLVRTQ